MIDIQKAKDVFKKYIEKYDITNGKIALKVAHIERTSKTALELAKALKLSDEDIKLAELIGLLHDIGRFEQVRIYDTFQDSKSINHGEYGVKVLFEDNLIREFLEETKYDEIIRKAILNHNRGSENIDKDLTDRELLHVKIIRDADKTDIYYTCLNEAKSSVYGIEDLEKYKITKSIYEEIINTKKVTYKNMQSPVDMVLAHLIFVYDFNYLYTFKVIEKNNYITKLYENIKIEDEKSQKMLETVYNNVQNYIKDKINNKG